MREIIQHERRIEFAFEGKRWYDLLRWEKAIEKLNGNLHAVVITADNGGWKYEYVPAANGKRKFEERNYLLPIPQSARDQNPNLNPQNPGY